MSRVVVDGGSGSGWLSGGILGSWDCFAWARGGGDREAVHLSKPTEVHIAQS